MAARQPIAADVARCSQEHCVIKDACARWHDPPADRYATSYIRPESHGPDGCELLIRRHEEPSR